MFENYVTAKSSKRRTWVSALVAISFTVHTVGVVALVIHGFWALDRLAPPKRQLAMSIAPPPPAPPPPPKPSEKTKVEVPPDKKIVNKLRPRDTTQPVEAKQPDPDVHVVLVDGESDIEGVDIGQTGVGLDSMTLDIPEQKRFDAPPPPPKPVSPKPVSPKAIDAQRISGDKAILPDDATKLQIQRDGNTRVVAGVRVCISHTGAVTEARVIKPSGYPAYDRRLASNVRQWRYAPFMIDGKPHAVCSSVTFVYVQN